MTTVDVDDVVHHAGDGELPRADGTGGIWLKVLRVDAGAGSRVGRNRIDPGAKLRWPGVLAAYELRAFAVRFERPTGVIVG